jgi:hypothetical protein
MQSVVEFRRHHPRVQHRRDPHRPARLRAHPALRRGQRQGLRAPARRPGMSMWIVVPD